MFDFLTLTDETREPELQRGSCRSTFAISCWNWAWASPSSEASTTWRSRGRTIYLDLLFYHLLLRAFVVIDLKAGAFKPEFAGKMNFYLSAVDDPFRHPDDRSSIGFILCKARHRVTAEYCL